MRYVELNPVRAGLTASPEAYRWSSYRVHALGVSDDLIVPHEMYLALGDTASIRQHCWQTICRDALSSAQLAEVRDLVHHGGTLGRIESKD